MRKQIGNEVAAESNRVQRKAGRFGAPLVDGEPVAGKKWVAELRKALNRIDSYNTFHYWLDGLEKDDGKQLIDGKPLIDEFLMTAAVSCKYYGGESFCEVIEILLKNGADINGRDDYGKAAIARAIESGDFEAVKLLAEAAEKEKIKHPKKKVADLNSRWIIGKDSGVGGEFSLLMLAVSEAQEAHNKSLMHFNEKDLQEYHDKSAWKFNEKRFLIARFLVESGADLNTRHSIREVEFTDMDFIKANNDVAAYLKDAIEKRQGTVG